MAHKLRNIPAYIFVVVAGLAGAAPLAFDINSAQAQVAESDRFYAPSGRAFDPNRDGSKVVTGSRSEIETRADNYEAENYRRQLEKQARREHLRRFEGHDFNRPFGPYNDY